MYIEIIDAQYLDNYRIKLHFSDDKEQIVDFRIFLENSTNPTTSKYLGLDLFKQFKIEYGDLIWNDYELCFPIIELYENTISKDIRFVA